MWCVQPLVIAPEHCSDLSVFAALLCMSCTFAWGNTTAWLTIRTALCFIHQAAEHYLSSCEDEENVKKLPVRNKVWKKQESSVKEWQDKAAQVGIRCSDLWGQIPSSCCMRLPGPIRGVVAPQSSSILILAMNITNMNCHVHDSKRPAKTEEISKSFENAGHFFWYITLSMQE